MCIRLKDNRYVLYLVHQNTVLMTFLADRPNLVFSASISPGEPHCFDTSLWWMLVSLSFTKCRKIYHKWRLNNAKHSSEAVTRFRVCDSLRLWAADSSCICSQLTINAIVWWLRLNLREKKDRIWPKINALPLRHYKKTVYLTINIWLSL